MTTFPKPLTDRQREQRRQHAVAKRQRTQRARNWIALAEVGETAMTLIKRLWPTCEAVTVRIHEDWRCTCGRTLKGWDVVVDDTEGARLPIRVICSGCHTELLAMERYRAAGEPDSAA